MMDLQTARKVRELFGPCSSLYECHTEQELVDDYAELAAEHGDNPTVFGYWLGIQLSIEDAFGIHSDIIKEIRNRLRPYWNVRRELPASHRKAVA